MRSRFNFVIKAVTLTAKKTSDKFKFQNLCTLVEVAEKFLRGFWKNRVKVFEDDFRRRCIDYVI